MYLVDRRFPSSAVANPGSVDCSDALTGRGQQCRPLEKYAVRDSGGELFATLRVCILITPPSFYDQWLGLHRYFNKLAIVLENLTPTLT